MKLTTVEKCENLLTINSVYAGLSFGFFLKLQKEKKKVRDTEQKCTGTNAAGTSLDQHCPLLDTRQKSKRNNWCLGRCEAHHLEMKSTNSGEKPSAGSCGDGSSTTCLSC